MSNSDNFTIGFNIDSTDYSAELGVRVYYDTKLIHENSHVNKPYSVSHEISDQDGEHELVIELFGKQPKHTTINDAGEIIKDAMLIVKDMEFDGIDVSNVLSITGQYTHDFNGTQSPVTTRFYNNLGCNGTVTMKFTTPFYLWLLENM